MASQPEEVAAGVFRLSIHWTNIYFVRSASSWGLIDAAWTNSGRLILKTAESLFGANTRPSAIYLTHAHPDHSGSALELARMWDVPVYVHPRELLPATGDMSAFAEYPAGPIDRWVIVPLMRVMPRRTREAALAHEAAFREVARALVPGAGIPGLPGWECVPTPGHSPGHVAFFRSSDRVLISGDALLTVNLNSLWDLVRLKRRVSGPPYISSWNWRVAKESVATLARLEPRVLACGHAAPMAGADVAREVRAFAGRFSAHAQEPVEV
jgi:glyoxylase-like metal-dependent hydrolase (beta-lactamase superfamily II)